MAPRKNPATKAKLKPSEVSNQDPNGSESSDSGSRRSSSAPDELAPETIQYQLRNCLSQVQYVGTFTASQACQKVVDPGLFVKGIGNIGLPLTSSDAQQIMSKGQQSPFGRGSDTVVDTSFRKTIELNPDKFRLRNPAWQEELQDIISKLAPKLGFHDGTSSIKAELYKLLLYNRGAMFKPHKDSEKCDGMFGTLIICLPSKHSGGSLLFTHRGETVVFETAKSSEFGQSHAAWYSDVSHEIKPVKSGYRMVLTYNLIHIDRKGPSSADVISNEKARLETILNDWNSRYKAGLSVPRKLIHILDHKYSEASLGLNRLKGRDLLLGRYLSEVGNEKDFLLMFGHLTLTLLDVEGSKEQGEEPEETLELSHIVGADGKLLLHDAATSNDEIIGENCYDRWPDEINDEETGDEGVDSTHIYRDAVAIVMPVALLTEFLLHDLANSDIIQWVKDLSAKINDIECRDRLIKICKLEAKAYQKRKDQELRASMIDACSALGNTELLLEVVSGCAKSNWRLDGTIAAALANTLHKFHFADVEASFDKFTEYMQCIHQQMTRIDKLRSSYQDSKHEGVALSESRKYDKWEKAKILDFLDSAKNLMSDDATHLVGLAKRFGRKVREDHIIPMLKKHYTATPAVISCLTEFCDAGKRGELTPKVANQPFDDMVTYVTSSLSFGRLFSNKKSSNEPYVPNYFSYGGPGQKQDYIARTVATFYGRCLSADRTKEADAVLGWLRNEVETADLSIFPAFILYFIPELNDSLQDYGFDVSEKLQETCQHMMVTLLKRCVGLEPAKPSTWARSPAGCGSKKCKLCPELDKFLADPIQEIGFLKDEAKERFSVRHLYSRAEFHGDHECEEDHEMEDGSKMLKVKKTMTAWKRDHVAWTRRWQEVVDEVRKCMDAARPLFGERFDEIHELRPIKAPE